MSYVEDVRRGRTYLYTVSFPTYCAIHRTMITEKKIQIRTVKTYKYHNKTEIRVIRRHMGITFPSNEIETVKIIEKIHVE